MKGAKREAHVQEQRCTVSILFIGAVGLGRGGEGEAELEAEVGMVEEEPHRRAAEHRVRLPPSPDKSRPCFLHASANATRHLCDFLGTALVGSSLTHALRSARCDGEGAARESSPEQAGAAQEEQPDREHERAGAEGSGKGG
eukprot:2144495-Rhodomonas_salina.2